jgi:hypothetical protein
MKRDPDFFFVPEKQLAMHARLENWARSCWGGYGTSVHPMFRQYRSAEHWHAPSASVPIDQQDASKIAKGVAMLPEPHMRSLQWWYIKPTSPLRARREIGCTLAGLARYVIDGRQMLINRRV